jgi:hypothetical protein
MVTKPKTKRAAARSLKAKAATPPIAAPVDPADSAAKRKAQYAKQEQTTDAAQPAQPVANDSIVPELASDAEQPVASNADDEAVCVTPRLQDEAKHDRALQAHGWLLETLEVHREIKRLRKEIKEAEDTIEHRSRLTWKTWTTQIGLTYMDLHSEAVRRSNANRGGVYNTAFSRLLKQYELDERWLDHTTRGDLLWLMRHLREIEELRDDDASINHPTVARRHWGKKIKDEEPPTDPNPGDTNATGDTGNDNQGDGETGDTGNANQCDGETGDTGNANQCDGETGDTGNNNSGDTNTAGNNNQDDDDPCVWTYYSEQFDNLDASLECIAKDLRETTDLSTGIEAGDRAKAIERLTRTINKTHACVAALRMNDKRHLNESDNPYGWFPYMYPRETKTIGELMDYIAEGISKGAARDNLLFIMPNQDIGDLYQVIAGFCDSMGPPDHPPHLTLDPIGADHEEEPDLKKKYLELKTKLTDAKNEIKKLKPRRSRNSKRS